MPGPVAFTRQERWDEGLRVLTLYIAREGHANVPYEHAEDGMPLGKWVGAKRGQYRRGRMNDERAATLEALPGWVWDAVEVSRANLNCILERKEFEFSDALIKAHGIIVDALANTEIVIPGESVDVMTNVYLNLAKGSENGAQQTKIGVIAPANWKVEQLASDAEQGATQPGMRQRERPDESSRVRVTVPQDEPATEPYWLRRERTREQFDWDERHAAHASVRGTATGVSGGRCSRG